MPYVRSARPVVLPRDLAAQEGVETEWWYYHGHLASEERRFAFMAVFFRRRTARDRVGPIPLRWVADQVHFAHFAVTDVSAQRSYWSHQRSMNGDSGAAADRFHVWVRDWSARETEGRHMLAVSSRMASLDLELVPAKPAVLHGDGGIIEKLAGQASHYVSYPRMHARGTLVADGREHPVHGTAWMDREFGTWDICEQFCAWDWMGIQLDDGRELMLRLLCDGSLRPTRFSRLTVVEPDGASREMPLDSFELAVEDRWRSPATGVSYPSRWRMNVPDLRAELEIVPVLPCQEMDTRGSTQVIYWEGAAKVRGRLGGRAVSGDAFLELVGHDRASPRLTIRRCLANEVRYRLRGREGVTEQAACP